MKLAQPPAPLAAGRYREAQLRLLPASGLSWRHHRHDAQAGPARCGWSETHERGRRYRRRSRHHVLDDSSAAAGGVAKDGVAFIEFLEMAAREKIKPLPINVDGALASVLHDLGFSPPAGKLLVIVGRVAGLTAEVVEEYAREKAMRILNTTACRLAHLTSHVGSEG
jgi:hypothetical protein